MKKFFCVLIIYIMRIGAVVMAQPTSGGFSVFEMTFGGGQGNCIIPAGTAIENANYIIAGKFGGDGCIVNTTVNGSVFWSKKIIAGGIDELNSVVRTPDGGYAVIGTSYSIPNCIDGVYIAKFDVIGTLIWQKGYRDDHSGSNSSILVSTIENTDDGGFLIGGKTSGFSPYNAAAFLFKIDSVGNICWFKIMNGPSRVCSIRKIYNGYIATGYYMEHLFLLRFSEGENILWGKTYGGEKTEIGECVKQTSDSGFIAVGWTESFSLTEEIKIFVVKTDMNGDTLWTRAISDGSPKRAYSVVEVSDGYVLSGYNGGSGSGSYLIKIDKFGNFLWHRVFSEGDGAIDCNYSIVAISNGFILTGVDDYGLSFIKTDLSGRNGCEQDGDAISYPVPAVVGNMSFTEQYVNPIVENVSFTTIDYGIVDTSCYNFITDVVENNHKIKVFPNPTTNYVNVVNAGKSVFSLFNSFGELVLEKKVNNREETVNFNLPNGIYFYSLGTKSGKIIVSK